MNDLYSLTQVIKSSPQFKLQREQIFNLYRTLGQVGRLDCENLLQHLSKSQPDLVEYLYKNAEDYEKNFAQTWSLRTQGVQFLVFGEELFPPSCYWMQDPPLSLSYVGSPAWMLKRSISVVGSREPSEHSLSWMEREFAKFCETENVCVISGGARGVDQKAHSLALRKGSATVIVLPSGLGNLYPHNLSEWMAPVLAQGGCFVSEYAYQQKMHKYLFHHRNRLIAALGSSVLLVEAKRRSGTLITAQQALILGRAVAVVPGHPLDPNFGGSLDLLSEGAFLVRDAQDLSYFYRSELCEDKPQRVTVGGLGELAY